MVDFRVEKEGKIDDEGNTLNFGDGRGLES